MPRIALPPFTEATAKLQVRLVEDAWNSRNPARVALSYTIDCIWRIDVEFLSGRAAIEGFLARKWSKQLDYRSIGELWAFTDDRIAARFACEYQDRSGAWFRGYGNEDWEYDQDGLVRRCLANFSDHPIAEPDRVLSWPLGRRPDDHPDLSDFDL